MGYILEGCCWRFDVRGLRVYAHPSPASLLLHEPSMRPNSMDVRDDMAVLDVLFLAQTCFNDSDVDVFT